MHRKAEDKAQKTKEEKLTAEEPQSEEAIAEAQPERDEKIQALLDEAMKEHKDQFLRLSADFANYKKRIEKERIDSFKFANEKLITELLGVVDNLERAMSHAGDQNNEESLLSGIKMVHKALMETLTRQGLEPIETIGKPFDHFLHHAVMTEASDEHEPDTILMELQKGYTLNGKVIRPSMVKVSTQS